MSDYDYLSASGSPRETGEDSYIGYVPNSDGSEGFDGSDHEGGARRQARGSGSVSGSGDESDLDLGWSTKQAGPVQSEGVPEHVKDVGERDVQPQKKRKLEDTESSRQSQPPHSKDNGHGQIDPAHPNGSISTSIASSIVPAQKPSGRPAYASKDPYPGYIMDSFFGIRPMDEFVRVLGEWIMNTCHDIAPEHVEIEIKLGTLKDKRSGDRIRLPVLSEVILDPNMDIRFESEMTMRQHKRLNEFLNHEVDNCAGRVPHPTLPPRTYHPITYSHLYLTDSSYSASQLAREAGFNHAKRRVSRNTKTGEVVAVIEKRRVGNINVFSPNNPFDWRLSVNAEVPCMMPEPNEKPDGTRQKDRLTYKNNFFQVDLTQVKQTSGHSETKVHELEIEVSHPPLFLYQGFEHTQNRPNNWEEQLMSLFNTIRLLNRNAGPV